jgi:hypothetical protein
VVGALNVRVSKTEKEPATVWRSGGENLGKAGTGGAENEDWGVVPDKVVKLDLKERAAQKEHLRQHARGKAAKNFKDRQLDAAVEHLRKEIKAGWRKVR